MLQSKNRLQKNEDFQEVFKNGKSVANRQFVLYLMPKEGQDLIRVGLSVSKKLGKAVVRNRIKRLIRESLRPLLPQIPWKGDLIVIARLPVVEMEQTELAASLTHCLRKAKLLS